MRILMLGNSFTYYHDLPDMVAELTGAEVRSHTRGGARLAEQLNERTEMGARTMKALREERWDYVVLQEQSNAPSTTPKAYRKNVARLCALVRQAGAVPVIYATWAYEKGNDWYAKESMTYDALYEGLTASFTEAARENGALLAPAGEAFRRGSAEGAALYDPDGRHPSAEGSRLAAGIIAGTILAYERGSRNA